MLYIFFINLKVFCIGTDDHPGPIHLRNCSVETFPPFIRAKCAYPGDSGSIVTGFQVIALSVDFDRLGKLYANYTSEGQTSATVEVEQNGEFLVSVIPVLGETGIVNSSVEYSEVVVVEDLLTATGITLANINCNGHYCPIFGGASTASEATLSSCPLRFAVYVGGFSTCNQSLRR